MLGAQAAGLHCERGMFSESQPDRAARRAIVSGQAGDIDIRTDDAPIFPIMGLGVYHVMRGTISATHTRERSFPTFQLSQCAARRAAGIIRLRQGFRLYRSA